MSEETPKYYAVMTDVGAELEARALAEGKALVLTHIAIGDANRQEVRPSVTATKLVREVYRLPIDSKVRDEHDRNVTLLHATIAANVGGWWIYELGVIGHIEGDEEEFLYAYANHARYYKVLPSDGQSMTHTVTIPIIQCTNAEVTINIMDEGYATAEQFRVLESEMESVLLSQVSALTRDAQLSRRLTNDELARIAHKNEVELAFLEQQSIEEQRYIREANIIRDTLLLSKRLTNEQLTSISLYNEYNELILQEENNKLSEDFRESRTYKIIVHALQRLTQLEFDQKNGIDVNAVPIYNDVMSPAGYTSVGGSTVSPVSLVMPGDVVPSNASLALVFG